MQNFTSLRQLIQVVEEFRKIDPEIQAQTVMTFLMVADKPGISFKQLQEKLVVASSTTSRNVTYLSSHTYQAAKNKRKGHGLVEARENPENRKEKEVYLTTKGKRFLNSVLYIISGNEENGGS